MGMDNYIYKIENKKLNSNKELEDYMDINSWYCMKKLYYFRRHYWLDNFFRQECKNNRNYDEVILTKEDIENLINEIMCALLTNSTGIFNKDDFYHDNYIDELKNVLNHLNSLINEDFNNNTIFYDSCS